MMRGAKFVGAWILFKSLLTCQCADSSKHAYGWNLYLVTFLYSSALKVMYLSSNASETGISFFFWN